MKKIPKSFQSRQSFPFYFFYALFSCLAFFFSSPFLPSPFFPPWQRGGYLVHVVAKSNKSLHSALGFQSGHIKMSSRRIHLVMCVFSGFSHVSFAALSALDLSFLSAFSVLLAWFFFHSSTAFGASATQSSMILSVG